MIFEELPRDIICHITGFLVNEKVHSILHVEDYQRLSLVNKEINSYVNKYKKYIVDTFERYEKDKQNHMEKTRILMKMIIHFNQIIPPVCSNDCCIGCGEKLPYWFPVLFTHQYKEIVNFKEKFTRLTRFELEGLKKGLCRKNKECMELFFYNTDFNFDYEYENAFDRTFCNNCSSCLDCKVKLLYPCIMCKRKRNPTLIGNINSNCKYPGACNRCYYNAGEMII